MNTALEACTQQVCSLRPVVEGLSWIVTIIDVGGLFSSDKIVLKKTLKSKNSRRWIPASKVSLFDRDYLQTNVSEVNFQDHASFPLLYSKTNQNADFEAFSTHCTRDKCKSIANRHNRIIYAFYLSLQCSLFLSELHNLLFHEHSFTLPYTVHVDSRDIFFVSLLA